MTSTEENSKCCHCLSFLTGMKLLFAWGLFWMFCWFMTCQFIWTGEYNDFNNGGFIVRRAPVVVFCTIITLISVILTGVYFVKDTARTRLGLVAASGIMLIIAIVFVIGGVPIMWIDIFAMTYSLKKTWEHYTEKESENNYDTLV